MTEKAYHLSENQRKVIHMITGGIVTASDLVEVFSNILKDDGLSSAIHELWDKTKHPHPMFPHIEGHDAVRRHLREQGFVGREVSCLMTFNFYRGQAHTLENIMDHLNKDEAVELLLRIPNTGHVTVKRLLTKCLSKNWIHSEYALKSIRSYLGGGRWSV